MFVQGFEYGEGQCALRTLAFVARLYPHERLVAFQQAPNPGQEPLKFAVLETIVTIQLLLKLNTIELTCIVKIDL